ncbi:hypothetical protein [Clostridium oceanicum]
MIKTLAIIDTKHKLGVWFVSMINIYTIDTNLSKKAKEKASI